MLLEVRECGSFTERKHEPHPRVREAPLALPTCLLPLFVFVLLLIVLPYQFFMAWSNFFFGPQLEHRKMPRTAAR
jgi:hypothetical protein